jgi:hypothetical protein
MTLKTNTVQNAEIIKGIVSNTYLNPLKDKIPNQLASKIVPVLSVNPERVVNIIKSGSTAGTLVLYTTPANQDFYLTNANLTTTAGNMVNAALRVIQGGATVDILNVDVGAVLLSPVGVAGNYNTPIKVDRGTNISLVCSAAAGYATICGYTVNNI